MRHRPSASFLLGVIFVATAWGGTDVRELRVRRSIGAGHYAEAFDQVAVVIATADDRAHFYGLLAEAGQYSGRTREADSLLGLCARRGWDVPEALIAEGWLDAHRALWFEAYSHYQAALHLGGPSVKAVAGIQEMHEKLHGREAAISHLLALGHSRQRTAAVWYALAVAYWSQWDLAQASFAIDRSLRSGVVDPRVGHLELAIRSSLSPGAENRRRLANAYRDAYLAGDWEGMAFLAWGRMTAFEAAGLIDSSERIRQDGLRFTRELGLIGWHGQFLLEEGRVAFARGDVSDALCTTDSAMSCFRLAGDYDGILAASALRLSLLLDAFRAPEALDCCFRMLTEIDGRCDPRLYAGAAIDAAWILSRMGGQRIALVLGIHAEGILEHMLYAAHDRCRLNSTLAMVHVSLGDTALAARYARSAWDLACSPGGSEELRANCEGVLGDLARARDDLPGARRQYLGQWRRASRTSNIGERKSAALALARLAFRMRQGREVVRWVDTTLALARLTCDPHARAEAHLVRGLQADRDGDRGLARTELHLAQTSLLALQRVREICSLTREMREWYIGQHTELAQGLVRLGEIEPAAVLLAQARSDVWESGPGSMPPERDHQRRALSATIHRWILRGPLEESAYSDSAIATLGAFFAALVAPDGCHGTELDGAMAGTASAPPRAGVLRRAVGDREVALEMLVAPGRADVIIMTRDTVASCRLDHGGAEWSALTDADVLEGALAPRAVSPAGRGGERWLRPALPLLLRVAGRRDHLVVVGEGVQRRFLFEATPLGDTPADGLLTDRFAVSYRPFLPLAMRRVGQGGEDRRGILVVADPAITLPADPIQVAARFAGEADPGTGVAESLPGAWKEIACLKQRFGAHVDVLTGAQASKTNFCALAPFYAVIHLATHGTSRTEGETGHHVMLAPSEGMDGELRIEDIVTLDLRSTVVVLPACLSARSSATGDMESIAEAFLRAGASSVLAARYTLDDEVSGEFLEAFYDGLGRGETGGMAVRRAMHAMIERGHHAPAVWAGFQLYGDGTAVPGMDIVGKRDETRAWPVWPAALALLSMLAWFAWKKARRSVPSQAHGEGSE